MSRVTAAVAVVLVALTAGCGTRRSSTVPEELVGVWRTPTPPYADRYFELRPDAIVFGTGEGGSSSHPIDRVESRRQGPLTLYTVFYRDGEQRYRWAFLYDPVGRSIRMKNRVGIVWSKSR
ncbi:MAG: hypothetical protein QN141_12110 [Armatimonadota bacterium]|nr:hypothetical protein [Armatimonadota bacterium]MDR7452332.1 hypothetical protein [Armatimonadota bacterium]MDR7467777.1 hypothetical protein [Armatimonadota bacterium]MDR7494637.1 hypothetical protein [Armatimonadota bacterium]MDR7499697.1 hypothetical protein [Armatimonadota bacterium]